MNKYNCLTPADRILAYLDREEQLDKKVIELDPEDEALLNLSSEELEAEALSIDPDHIAHLEYLRGMVGLAVKNRDVAEAAPRRDGMDAKDDGIDASGCNLPASMESDYAAKIHIGSLWTSYHHRYYAGANARGRVIGRGTGYPVRTHRRLNQKMTVARAVLRSSVAVLVLGAMSSSFLIDYRQNNSLAELTSRVNSITSALRTSDEADGRAYNAAIMNWMFDPSANTLKSATYFDCSAYCRKREWSVTREKNIYKAAFYGSVPNTEKIYASK